MVELIDSQAPSDQHSESLYAGGFDKDEFPYIARVYWSQSLKVTTSYMSNRSAFLLFDRQVLLRYWPLIWLMEKAW